MPAHTPLGTILVDVLGHHPGCPFADLWKIPLSFCHDSILSRNGVSGKSEVIQREKWPHMAQLGLICHADDVRLQR